MSEPLPSTSVPAEAIAYRPISGWAIAGLASGGLFAILVALSTMVGLFQGSPVFFPIWIMALAILGVVFSLVGQRHVQNSEGTRAGGRLASVGIWLSLVSGLTYFSYYFVTGLALQSQANAFVMEESEDAGFFPRLRKAGGDNIQFNTAFLLTQPPNARGGRPDNEPSMRLNHDTPGKEGASGALSQFRESTLPRVLYKGLGADAEIMPQATQEWRYEKRSYKIARAYRIKTKEVEFEFLLSVWSMEPEAAGQARKWFVNMRESYMIPQSKKLTPTGEGIRSLRQQAADALMQKFHALNEGAGLANVKDVDLTVWESVTVDDAKRRNEYRTQVHQIFASNEKQRLKDYRIYTPPDEPGKWEQVEGKIRMNVVFTCTCLRDGGPGIKVEGNAVLDTKQAIDPARFDANSPRPDWSLVEIVFMAVAGPDRKSGPGP